MQSDNTFWTLLVPYSATVSGTFPLRHCCLGREYKSSPFHPSPLPVCRRAARLFREAMSLGACHGKFHPLRRTPQNGRSPRDSGPLLFTGGRGAYRRSGLTAAASRGDWSSPAHCVVHRAVCLWVTIHYCRRECNYVVCTWVSEFFFGVCVWGGVIWYSCHSIIRGAQSSKSV